MPYSLSTTAWDSAEITHTYAEAKEYEITLTGKIIGWSFSNNSEAKKIT